MLFESHFSVHMSIIFCFAPGQNVTRPFWKVRSWKLTQNGGVGFTDSQVGLTGGQRLGLCGCQPLMVVWNGEGVVCCAGSTRHILPVKSCQPVHCSRAEPSGNEFQCSQQLATGNFHHGGLIALLCNEQEKSSTALPAQWEHMEPGQALLPNQ